MGEHGNYARENLQKPLLKNVDVRSSSSSAIMPANQLDQELWKVRGKLVSHFLQAELPLRPHDVLERLAKTRSGILQEDIWFSSLPSRASECIRFAQTSVDSAFQRARTADVWQLKALNQCLEELELAQEAHFQAAFTVASAERALSPYEEYNKSFSTLQPLLDRTCLWTTSPKLCRVLIRKS